MCGRYTLSKLEQMLRQIPSVTEPLLQFAARYNIAPTQPVAAISNQQPDRVTHFYWGLVPSWAKDVSIGSKMINARAETVAEKPSYRVALRRRRCLIPADGFYEWRVEPRGQLKTPFYIRMKSGEPFAFAGLWETWQDAGGSELQSCTIITTTPNKLMKSLHDRMPVILPSEAYGRWLDPKERDAEAFTSLLRAYPDEEMEAYPVSRRVNTAKVDNRTLIEPAPPETLF